MKLASFITAVRVSLAHALGVILIVSGCEHTTPSQKVNTNTYQISS